MDNSLITVPETDFNENKKVCLILTPKEEESYHFGHYLSNQGRPAVSIKPVRLEVLHLVGSIVGS